MVRTPKTLTRAIDECFYGSGRGRYSRCGKWEIGLGGYDTGYEISYDGKPLFALTDKNVLKLYREVKWIENFTTYSFESIVNAIEEAIDDRIEIEEVKKSFREIDA